MGLVGSSNLAESFERPDGASRGPAGARACAVVHALPAAPLRAP